MPEPRRCIDCNRKIRLTNKVGKCSYCQRRNYWKEKYESLKAEFEQHKKLCSKIMLEYYNKLKKYELNISWDEEPE